jgi:hypothetical protein
VKWNGESTDSLVATTRLDDKDNCYNQVLMDNYDVVTPEKPTAVESNAIVGEEHTYPPKPILRSTSAKNRHLLLALKLTPEKAFHFLPEVGQPQELVARMTIP